MDELPRINAEADQRRAAARERIAAAEARAERVTRRLRVLAAEGAAWAERNLRDVPHDQLAARRHPDPADEA